MIIMLEKRVLIAPTVTLIVKMRRISVVIKMKDVEGLTDRMLDLQKATVIIIMKIITLLNKKWVTVVLILNLVKSIKKRTTMLVVPTLLIERILVV